MLYVRLTHAFETMVLDEFHDPSKARFHVGGQRLKLVSNAGIEQFNDPRHPYYSIAFLQYHWHPES